MPERITLAEFATRRGVKRQTVYHAAKVGRFSSACYVRGEDGKAWITDLEVALREWDANADRTRAPAYVKEREAQRQAAEESGSEEDEDEPAGSIASETEKEKKWKAKLAEMKFRKEAGQLVWAKDVTAKIAERAARAKTHLLALPSKFKSRAPHIDVADITLLEELIREALTDLAPAEPDES